MKIIMGEGKSRIAKNGSVYSAIQHQYSKIENLPKSKYDLILGQLEGGWVRFHKNGNIDLTKVYKANPDVSKNVISKIAETANIDKDYCGYYMLGGV